VAPLAVTAPLILVADNDHAVSSLLCEVLRRAGLRVEAVYDGDQALASVLGSTVAVFICDLDMPRRSGLEVVEGLRAHASPPATLVISGYLDQGLTQRLEGLPWVRGLLHKPFDLMAFALQVRQLAAGVAGTDPVALAASPEH
jgi:CheY-like chemotaxis protein